MSVSIPLFPLGLVLFPHMPLPLHIFEERYRVMMRDCQENGTGFGIVGLQDGLESGGGPARPYAVGTLAQLRRVEELEDGRFNILVVGASRFRVSGISTRRPYLTAHVEWLRDGSGDGARSQRLAARVATLFQRYATALRELADESAAEIDLPDDPELLSYLVAASLQVDNRHKQPLLEMDDADTRLAGCVRLLGRELVLLSRRLAHRNTPLEAVSRN